MIRTKVVSAALFCTLLAVASANATQYFDLGLHGRVQASHVVVLARVVDPALARVDVERVLKGDPPKQIKLVDYVDGFAVPSQGKPLVADAQELLFLIQKGDAYAPLQDQYGRMAVDGDRLIDSFRAEPRSLSRTVASIQRLVALQTRAGGRDSEADQAYVVALADSDVEVQKWALSTAHQRIRAPSPALEGALLAHWKNDSDPVPNTWPHSAGLVANAVVTWRLRHAAPVLADTLKISSDGERRAFAAMALGGTGDRSYLPLLREVAVRDVHAPARALAYRGIMCMLGPDSLGDLRLGAKDGDAKVRAQAVVDAYNLLELGHPEPRWPPPSTALIAEVRTFLTEMERDPARLVSDNAKLMLGRIAASHGSAGAAPTR